MMKFRENPQVNKKKTTQKQKQRKTYVKKFVLFKNENSGHESKTYRSKF